mmetsp:Transcript_11170/g.35749  ORF Transcript_11170/g.35749 Transcript_11170/m.35749 type:complete len:290 (-) Transcript_11170:511-1380(-)
MLSAFGPEALEADREAEVDKPCARLARLARLLLADDDVCLLDVSVHEPSCMKRLHLGRHVAQQAGHGAEGGRGAEEAQHVLPLDEAHHDEASQAARLGGEAVRAVERFEWWSDDGAAAASAPDDAAAATAGDGVAGGALARDGEQRRDLEPEALRVHRRNLGCSRAVCASVGPERLIAGSGEGRGEGDGPPGELEGEHLPGVTSPYAPDNSKLAEPEGAEELVVVDPGGALGRSQFRHAQRRQHAVSCRARGWRKRARGQIPHGLRGGVALGLTPARAPPVAPSLEQLC